MRWPDLAEHRTGDPMDKLEMKITLTSSTVPRLLAYLEALPGARERALVRKLLAELPLEASIYPLELAPSLPAAVQASSNNASPGVSAKRKAGGAHHRPACFTKGAGGQVSTADRRRFPDYLGNFFSWRETIRR